MILSLLFLKSRYSFFRLPPTLVVIASVTVAFTAPGANLTWDNGASTAIWNTADLNWTGSTRNNSVINNAIFGATGAGSITIEGDDKEWGKVFGPLVKSQPHAQTLPARPDLPWASATMDQAAMTRFQAEYLAAFLARKL